MKNILLLMLTVLFFQCGSDKTNKLVKTDEHDKFFVIPYEDALRNKKTIKLSDIAEEVNYIPLQTDSNCLLAGNPEYYFTEQFIFIENRDHVLVFDYAGKFLRKIGTPGKGPNEIDLIRMLVVNDKEKSLIIQTNSNSKLLYFDFYGNFIESIPVFDYMRIYTVKKDRFVIYDNGSSGYEDYILRLTNRKNDTISTVKNHFKWKNTTGSFFGIGYWGFYPYYINKDKPYFKTIYNDTVFTVIGDKFMPAFYIDLGKYRLPNDARFENPVSMDKFRKVQNIYFWASAMEAADYVFVTSLNYADSLQRNILHQLGDSESSLLVKQYGESAGFINNWDGGPEFWPAGKVNDQSIFMPVSPIILMDMIEEDDFADKDVVYPDKNKDLMNMIKGLKEEDNVVLMVVKLKGK